MSHLAHMQTLPMNINMENLEIKILLLLCSCINSLKDLTVKCPFSCSVLKMNLTHIELSFESQALNFMRLSARIDATASRVQTAVTMKQVTNTL